MKSPQTATARASDGLDPTDDGHDLGTNEIPAPEELRQQQHGDEQDLRQQQEDEDANGEHQAFLPTLQFASGNDLSSIANYDHASHAGVASGHEDLRNGHHDTTIQPYDHWPTETQAQAVQGGITEQNANQFEQQQEQQEEEPQQHDGGSPSQLGASTASGDLMPYKYEQEGMNAAAEYQQAVQLHEAHQQMIEQQQQQHQQQHHQQQQHQHQLQQQHMHHHAVHGPSPYDRPTPGASYGTYEGAKPKRKRASPQQLTLLNNIFEMTYFPSSDLRLAIGKELDMTTRSVQIWFQNRRSHWRAKSQLIASENMKRKADLMAAGLSEGEADERIVAERTEIAAREMATQRANDAVEYTINGSDGSLAYALHGAVPTQQAAAAQLPIDDGSVVRDDDAGAWSVLQAFHQARTGVMVQEGHPMIVPRSPIANV